MNTTYANDPWKYNGTELEKSKALATANHAIIINSTNEPLALPDGTPIYMPLDILLNALKALFGTTDKNAVLLRCALIRQPVCES